MILLVASLLSIDTHSTERQTIFHSGVNGYSVAIPEGWKQVPNDVLETSIDVAASEEGKRAYYFETAIVTDSTTMLLNYPQSTHSSGEILGFWLAAIGEG